MRSRAIDLNGMRYLEVELIPVVQKGEGFFIGKVLAEDLLKLYTVRPAKYDLSKHTSYVKSFEDDKDYYEHLIRQDKKRISEKDFQRDYDKARVNKITNFLEEEEYPFFPNTIIATCDLLNDFKEYDLSEESSLDQFIAISDKPGQLSFLLKDHNRYLLYIPYNSDSILVIDGQHRLRGLEGVSEEIKSGYELLISFIIGFDRSVIAQLFYTINYEQKSVNKSLLYHLTGEFSSELDELTFMHNIVKVLNELDYSPFYGKIKMLGVNPKDATPEEKASLSISQAFLIDYLIKSISKTAINSYYQPIFLFYYRDKELQIEIARFIVKFFNAVKEIKADDWDNPSASILSKGIGIASLIRVLHFLYVKMFLDEWGSDPLKIKEVKTDTLIAKLKGLEKVDFSKEGEFGGAASGGSINKITQRIVICMDYFEFDNYSDFFDNYKEVYLLKFKDWIRTKA